MDCKYFDGCSAPLCPRSLLYLWIRLWFPSCEEIPINGLLCDGGVALRTWFPRTEVREEDICRLADVPDWVKRTLVRRQRKVSKKAARGGYFTLGMLKQDCRIAPGMKGIDPDGTDRERAADEAAWFKAHPVMTAEVREKLRTGGEKKKELLHRARLKKMRSNIGPDGVSGETGNQIPLALDRS